LRTARPSGLRVRAAEGIEACEGLQSSCSACARKVLRPLFRDRVETVLGEEHLRPGGFEPRLQQSGNREVQHGFLYGTVFAALEESLFHARHSPPM